MHKKEQILSKINEQGLMPLFYNDDLQVCISVIMSLYAAGVRLIEFTNRGEAALKNFSQLKRIVMKDMPDLFLGIGTIKNEKQASEFINAGADYLISPGIVEGICETANTAKVLWIPGCMTVTEILKAENMGLNFVKLFPGNMLGTEFVKAVKPVFPSIHFMPTGGVDTSSENLKSWFSSGVTAVGMGSNLISANIIKEKNYNELTKTAKNVLKTISIIKANKV